MLKKDFFFFVFFFGFLLQIKLIGSRKFANFSLVCCGAFNVVPDRASYQANDAQK